VVLEIHPYDIFLFNPIPSLGLVAMRVVSLLTFVSFASRESREASIVLAHVNETRKVRAAGAKEREIK